MARHSSGWTTRQKTPGGIYTVRWTQGGVTIEKSCGTRDRTEATRKAALIYAREIGRPRRTRTKTSAPGVESFELVIAEWIVDQRALLDETTCDTYENVYAGTHWIPFFGELAELNEVRAADYLSERLRNVSASTARKEMSALRSFVRWAAKRGHIAPFSVPGVPKRAVGVKHKQGRRGRAPELSPKEVAAVLRELKPYPKLHAYYSVLYATALRPATVQSLRVPEHYVPGRGYLVIERANDKARNPRRVPLAPEAQRALDAVAPESGPIFEWVGDHRYVLRKAAETALPADKARLFSRYHFKHNRLTHWLEDGASIPGVLHLSGITRVETLKHYIRTSERAAEAIVAPRKKRVR